MIRRHWDDQPKAARVDNVFFICPEIKCAYAIDFGALNKVQLLVLRRTRKTCPGCKALVQFQEQTALPNIQTKIPSLMEGQNNAKTSSLNTPRITAKRRTARDAGH